MPDHLKALGIILLLATPTLALAQQMAGAQAIPPHDFVRRRNLWLGIVLIAFLAHNFWVYVVATGLLLAYAAPRDQNRPALYFFLLFTIPQIGVEIPGLGIVRQLFVIDYVRLLALVVLLPAAMELRREERKSGELLTVADKLLLAYLALNVALQFFAVSFTGTMRNAFYSFIDIVLPYYVIGRSLRSLDRFRDALMSFVVAGLLMGALGAFEFAKHWLLYRSLSGALGVEWGYGDYLERGDSLRAMVSGGQPIVMGYVLAVAFGCFLFAQRSVSNLLAVTAGFALLIVGEIVPLSRGPWTGSAAIYLVYLLTGFRAMSRLGKRAAIGLLTLPILYFTPYWDKAINYLPFVGNIDEGNVAYRQRLLEVCVDIILDNPLFGSSDFLRYLEELRQGEGIIDIVNTYLLIALNCGLVGLSLFVGFFGTIMTGIFRRMRSFPADSELHQAGQALLAILAGILVMIFTVSPINQVPVIYWAVAGLGLAYIRLPKPASSP